MVQTYQAEYRKSIDEAEIFWAEKAAQLEWFSFPNSILSKDEDGVHHWFADGEMNTSYMAIDAHVNAGRGGQTAIIYDSPVTGVKEQISYQELLERVEQTAGMIQQAGVIKGDRVVLYMPMVPEAVYAMLACARLGAIHCVVFGGFAANELAVRIDDAKPKLVLSASCGIEVNRVIEYKPLLDKAGEIASFKNYNTIILQRPEHTASLGSTELDWRIAYEAAPRVGAVPVKGEDILYILYTSGTTGKPKGVARENGGHAVALHYSMSAIYDTHPGEVYWAASDVGWVVGHSYIVYAPLLAGCTTVLFEGKPIMTPDAGAFWRVIEEYQVKSLFTAPTAYRAIKKEDPSGALAKKYDTSALANLFSAGEKLDEATYHWLQDVIAKPVVDNWWQTETGWAIASNIIGIEPMPTKPGSATMPSLGYNIEILDDEGNICPPNTEGRIAVKLPLPPSCLTTIWGSKQRFIDGYLSIVPGYYISGDGGYIDEDGYLFVMGRTDDVINIAGHRLSTGEVEGVIAKHPDIAECCVIGIDDNLKGQLPLGFVILKSGSTTSKEQITTDLITMTRKHIGAIICYKETIFVDRLPKTRSGKILRKTIKQIVHGEEYTIPPTIDDPAILGEITNAVAHR